MSVKELQARIVKISADIDLQKEVLKQLEKDKSAAQRQLNAVQDPLVARFPLEISSKIFLECIPLPPVPGARFAPMLLLNVCHSWTTIALSTGALWAAIDIGFSGRPQAKRQILKLWLQRARNYPLSITLYNGLKNGAAPILGRYTKQIKCLGLYDEEFNVRRTTLTDFESFPCLERLAIGATGNEEDWSLGFSLAHTIRFLGLAQNLVELTLYSFITESDYKTTQKLVLPSLVCLKFGELPKLHHLSDSSADDILCHISLPALEILAIPFTTISCSDLSLFLKRSSPPLQKLVLDHGSNSFAFAELDEWLRLVPSLTHLEFLVRRETSTDNDLFSALADSASHLLPNLRSLTIHNASPSFSDSSWQTLLCALSARRSRLLQFKFTYFDCEPPADVCAGLRQLVADGMDIHIGSDYENLISI
ncbi:hypothetical protein B0H13DRAFT_2055059 [Mycena leptocephala]|nr:hypothetical protein B0H13DRAFT_2055059 [Mycena leptocephala]